MIGLFFNQFLSIFFLLFTLLILIKIVLTIYRMTKGVWPASLRFLIEIIDWKKESIKIGVLVILSFLIAAIQLFL